MAEDGAKFRTKKVTTEVTRNEGSATTHNQTVTYNAVQDVAIKELTAPKVTTVQDESIGTSAKKTVVDGPPSIAITFDFEMDGAGLG